MIKGGIKYLTLLVCPSSDHNSVEVFAPGFPGLFHNLIKSFAFQFTHVSAGFLRASQREADSHKNALACSCLVLKENAEGLKCFCLNMLLGECGLAGQFFFILPYPPMPGRDVSFDIEVKWYTFHDDFPLNCLA